MEEAKNLDLFLDLNYLTESSLFKIKDVNESTNKLLEEYKEIAINQVIQNFGLDKILNIYKDGGNVTTLHNFKNAVFSDDESKEKYNIMQAHKKKLDRSYYDRNVFKKNKDGALELVSMNVKNIREFSAKLTNEEISQIGDTIKIKPNDNSQKSKNKINVKVSDAAKNQIYSITNDNKKSRGKLKDGYNREHILSVEKTNKSNYQVEHINSIKSLSQNHAFNLFFTHDEQSIFVNSNDNITFITSDSNQSKGQLGPSEWGNKINKDGRSNIERFNKREEDIKFQENRSNERLRTETKEKARRYYTQKTMKASFSSGAKMGMKEMLGMLLYDLQNEFFKEMKYYFNNFKNFHKNKVKWQELTLCFSRIKDKVFNRAKSYFVGFSTGFISGFLGNILTVIINTFKTTYKRLARLIGETFNGIVKSVKLLLTAENDETKYKEAVKVFTATVIGALGGIMTESLITYLRTTPFSIFAELIGATVGGILTGMTVASAMYMIDDFKGFIESLKGIFSKDKYSQEELKAKFDELLSKIDEEYTIILKRIRREYLKLNELTMNAFNMELSATERFANTIDYASAMNVQEEKIVRNSKEIDDFFLN